jgi:hypothetical protein
MGWVCEDGHGPSVGTATVDPDRCTLASLDKGANTVTQHEYIALAGQSPCGEGEILPKGGLSLRKSSGRDTDQCCLSLRKYGGGDTTQCALNLRRSRASYGPKSSEPQEELRARHGSVLCATG